MRRYIAFLDILGFKDLVQNNPIDKLVNIYRESLKFASEHALPQWYEGEFQDDGLKLNATIISDSIIIWSEKTTTSCFAKVLFSTIFFFQACLLKGLPLRGAIEVGELATVNIDTENLNGQNIILGEALIKAFTTEKNQNWAGCIISDECVNSFLQNRTEGVDITLETLIESKFIRKYKVPLKKGSIRENYVINWCDSYYNNNDLASEENIREFFLLHNKQCTDWDIEVKIRNTIEYYNDCIKEYN